MQCLKCQETKLSKEFPSSTLNEKCDHAPLHCLRCVTTYAKKHDNRCSYAENKDQPCQQIIDENRLQICDVQLNALFPKIYPTSSESKSPVKAAAASAAKTRVGELIVKRIDGETTEIPYKETLSIREVKLQVQKKMKIRIEKQRLIYNGTVLQEMKDEKTSATVVTYDLQPDATIHLMVLLSAIPPTLTTVVFDLYWGWPDAGKDYLDASALVFSGKTYEGVADYKTLGFAKKAIYHSGDRIDKEKRQGHHFIKVNLKEIPKSFTHVFFTLSSYTSPEISHFKNLNFRFYDEDHPDKMLCSDQTKKGKSNQAIVMCSLSKMDGHWYVHDNGVVSNGCARNYPPLKNTILNIIDEWSM
ncbi:uncharacterized protein [Amphiura filiformis]|uniref:uncharacterized protein n=1 Tax=Amphiura filiformis TaxID=82378 RepID=UPI003B20E7DF